MQVKKNKSGPISNKQKEILVEFITTRKEMYTGKLTATYTREKIQKNWLELANILNSIPEGPAKDWKQWRKTWVDLKKNSMAKFSEQKKHSEGTGGGPPLPPLDVETKLVNIISPVAIRGNTCVQESNVRVDFEDIMEGDGNNNQKTNSEENEEVVEDREFICNYDGLKQNDYENYAVSNVHDYSLPSTSEENIPPKRMEGRNKIPVIPKKKRPMKKPHSYTMLYKIMPGF